MSEKYNPEPARYDQVRVRQLEPIRQAILSLRLPPRRYRKLHAILNALEVQIEDGGDNPEVNDCLLEALRLNIHHQVNEQQGQTALLAIDAFAQGEAQRRSQFGAGTLPTTDLTLQEQLDDLIQDGYMLLTRRRRIAAVDKWLAAWELVKQMATPAIRTTEAFDICFEPKGNRCGNWTARPKPKQSIKLWLRAVLTKDGATLDGRISITCILRVHQSMNALRNYCSKHWRGQRSTIGVMYWSG